MALVYFRRRPTFLCLLETVNLKHMHAVSYISQIELRDKLIYVVDLNILDRGVASVLKELIMCGCYEKP